MSTNDPGRPPLPRRRFLAGLAAGGTAITFPKLWIKAETDGVTRARGTVY